MLLKSSSGRPYAAIANKGDYTLMVHPILIPHKGHIALICHWRYTTTKTSLGKITLPNSDVFPEWDPGPFSARNQTGMLTGIPIRNITESTFLTFADLTVSVWNTHMKAPGVVLSDAPLRDDFKKEYADLCMSVYGSTYITEPPNEDLVGVALSPENLRAVMAGEPYTKPKPVDKTLEDAATSPLGKVVPLVPKT